MPHLVHISDLHFGPAYVPQAGDALLEETHRLCPDIVVASGDFTQRARPSQFRDARAFLNALPRVPHVLVPGNHDVPLYRLWERFRRPYGNYQQYISRNLDSVTCHDQVCLVALNSTAPYRAITNGRIRRSQLAYCESAFRQAPDDAVRVVVAHHHFAPAPDLERAEVMPKAKRALERFHELGVELILGGHLHRGYVGNSLDIYPGSDREQGIIIVQCGTSTSRRGRAREREKNSFNHIVIDDTTITVNHHMYFSATGSFAIVGRYIFPRLHQLSLAAL